MSAGQAFVGIDAGTTGCTVMIFDESGNRLGQGYQEYPCTSPRPGWIEQDVEEVWRGICEATKQAMAAAALPDSAYKSVGFSSQRGTFILLDEDKNPIAPSIVWNDGRALAYQEKFGKEISPDDYHTHTGMQLSPLWSAAKIAWLRDNEPELFRQTRWFANGQEYFLHRLGAARLGHRPGVADAQRHARHREARLERPRPRDVRHRPRPGAAGRHPVGPGRRGLGGRALRHGPARGPAGLPGGGRPAVRRHRRRRGGAGHGRVHRGHGRGHGRPPRRPRPHPGPQPVVGRPRRSRRLGHRGWCVRPRGVAEVVARQPRAQRAGRGGRPGPERLLGDGGQGADGACRVERADLPLVPGQPGHPVLRRRVEGRLDRAGPVPHRASTCSGRCWRAARSRCGWSSTRSSPTSSAGSPTCG